MKMGRLLLSTALAAFFLPSLVSDAYAASKVSLSGRIKNASGYKVLLVEEGGKLRSANIPGNGKFSFKNLQPKALKNASLQLLNASGQFMGPVILSGKGSKAYQALSGKLPKGSKKLDLGVISLKPGYAKVKKAPPAVAVTKKILTRATSQGVPLGAGKWGLADMGAQALAARKGGVTAVSEEPGGDLDQDGVINALDVDDDGDTVLDAADPESAQGSASNNVYSTLYLSMAQTLNVNTGGVTSEDIDAVIGGENLFAFAFWLSLPPETTNVTGGHVVCDPALSYCRPAASGGGTAVYSGMMESDPAVQNQLWTDFNADGSGYPNLEYSSSRSSVFGGIQPRVGTDQFRPGDIYTVELTGEGGAVVDSMLMSLSPYFVTVPALKSYDVGSGEVLVDYASAPGQNLDSPIVASSGTITLNFWRPQRLSVEGAEDGSFRDHGHLHYGLLIGGLPMEFTCGGFYSGLSESLTEGDWQGEGGSPLANQGAVLWPLTDSADDASPDAANTLSFTIDISGCLSRSGQSGGTHMVTLTAAGETLRGGANRAAQMFYVQVP